MIQRLFTKSILCLFFFLRCFSPAPARYGEKLDLAPAHALADPPGEREIDSLFVLFFSIQHSLMFYRSFLAPIFSGRLQPRSTIAIGRLCERRLAKISYFGTW